jgi:hypothetical protein
MASLRFGIAIVLLLAACKAAPPSFQTPGIDAGTGNPAASAPATPTVNAPDVTALATAALRGSSPGAARIVVQTAHAAQLTGIVLPDGTFCVDVPLQSAQANRLKVIAVANGKASPAAQVNVVQAPSGPTPANGTCTTMSGGGTPSCSDMSSTCDPHCNGCAEDPYQPNDSPAQAPAIALKSSYANLQLCPCRADWFTFVLYKGQHISVQASYQKTTDFDLAMSLFHGADVLPQSSGKPAVATAMQGMAGGRATSTIDFTATDGGAYYLQIAATTGDKTHDPTRS